jgi:hypothetical protein
MTFNLAHKGSFKKSMAKHDLHTSPLERPKLHFDSSDFNDPDEYYAMFLKL